MDDYGNLIGIMGECDFVAFWNERCDWFVDGCRWDGYIVDRFYGELS